MAIAAAYRNVLVREWPNHHLAMLTSLGTVAEVLAGLVRDLL